MPTGTHCIQPTIDQPVDLGHLADLRTMAEQDGPGLVTLDRDLFLDLVDDYFAALGCLEATEQELAEARHALARALDALTREGR